MPLYEFECRSCASRQEEFFKMADCPQETVCVHCGGNAAKIITFSGGIQTEEPLWLQGASGEQVRECLQDSARVKAGLDQPITTRSQHKAYLKEHGIVPLDKGNNIWMI